MFGVIFGFTWMVAMFLTFSTRRPTMIAAAVTALYALVAFVSAWRRVNPFEGFRPLNAGEWARFVVLQHRGAGIAAVV